VKKKRSNYGAQQFQKVKRAWGFRCGLIGLSIKGAMMLYPTKYLTNASDPVV